MQRMRLRAVVHTAYQSVVWPELTVMSKWGWGQWAGGAWGGTWHGQWSRHGAGSQRSGSRAPPPAPAGGWAAGSGAASSGDWPAGSGAEPAPAGGEAAGSYSAPASEAAPAGGGAAASSARPASGAAPAPAGGGADDVQRGEGRIAVGSWNFGQGYTVRRELHDIAARNLTTMPVSIQCSQEISVEMHDVIVGGGWIGTSRSNARNAELAPASGPASAATRSGLGVYAKETVARSVEEVAAGSWTNQDSGSAPAPAGGSRSWILSAVVTFHTPRSGFSDFVVTTTHLHAQTAKGHWTKKRRQMPRGAQMARREYFDALARCIASSRSRLIMGDLNMSMFTLVPELARRGVPCTLVSHHTELNRDGNPHYDSCGIWVVGGVGKVEQCSMTAHAVAGQRHPAILVPEAPQHAPAPAGGRNRARLTKINYQRGFPADSYCGDPPDWKPDEDTLEACREALRKMHTDKLEDGVWVFYWEDICIERANLVGFGSLSSLRQRAVAPHHPDDIPVHERDMNPPRDLGVTSVTLDPPLPQLDKVVEFLAKGSKWDTGHCWGRDGHWPLFVVLGGVKHYSQAHHQEAEVKDQKRLKWNKGRNGTPWPWGIYYSGEPRFWLPDGPPHFGGGWDGRHWLEARAQWSAAEVQEYEQPWVDAYGQEAADRCLAYCRHRWEQNAEVPSMPLRPPPQAPAPAGSEAMDSEEF